MACSPPDPQLLDGSLPIWLEKNLASNALVLVHGLHWSYLFPWVCFEIWKAQNLAVFKGKSVAQASHITFLARKQASEFINLTSKPPAEPLLITPTHGNIPLNVLSNYRDPTHKIYTDASFTNIYDPVGLGGMIRDPQGLLVFGFYKMTYAMSSLSVELLGIRE